MCIHASLTDEAVLKHSHFNGLIKVTVLVVVFLPSSPEFLPACRPNRRRVMRVETSLLCVCVFTGRAMCRHSGAHVRACVRVCVCARASVDFNFDFRLLNPDQSAD